MHYPNEKWFLIPADGLLPAGILDKRLHAFYDPEQELSASDQIYLQSGNSDRGICTLLFIRQSDQQTVYILMNIIGNLYIFNGMSAGKSTSSAASLLRIKVCVRVFTSYMYSRAVSCY